MAFLNRSAASETSGVLLLVEGGYVTSSIGSFESGTPLLQILASVG